MNDIQIFNSSEFGEIRTVEENGRAWFCGKDVAVALKYTNTKKAINDHCREDGVTIRSLIDSMGRRQDAKFINEPNLYRLIIHSKLPSAEKFERWVFEEVLPALRKTGHYETPQYKQQAKQRELTKDDYIRAASIISGCRNERLPYVMAFLEQAGLEMPEIEQINRQAKIVAQSGLAPDGKLEEYAGELMESGILHKNRIYVTITDFNSFCTSHGISPIKYKRWLYHNRYISIRKSKNGKLEYTATVWLDGEQRRCIVFEA